MKNTSLENGKGPHLHSHHNSIGHTPATSQTESNEGATDALRESPAEKQAQQHIGHDHHSGTMDHTPGIRGVWTIRKHGPCW